MKAKIALIAVLSQIPIGSTFLFNPILLKEVGMGDVEIGMLLSFSAFLSLVSNFLGGRIFDRNPSKFLLIASSLFSGLSLFFISIFPLKASCFLLLPSAYLFSGLFVGPIISELIALGFSVGTLSAILSLGWGLGMVMSGQIGKSTSVFLFSSLLFFLTSFFLFLIDIKAERVRIRKILDISIILRNKKVYLPYFIRHTGAQMVWTFLPLFMIEQGLKTNVIGQIYALNPFLQAILMPLVQFTRDEVGILLGLLLSFFSFSLYSLATKELHFYLASALTALSWSFLYVSSLEWLIKRNEEKASVSGGLSSTINLATICGSFLSGLLTQFLGFRLTFFLGSSLSLLALLIFLWPHRQRGGTTLNFSSP